MLRLGFNICILHFFFFIYNCFSCLSRKLDAGCLCVLSLNTEQQKAANLVLFKYSYSLLGRLYRFLIWQTNIIFSYHLFVKTQSYKCWTLNIKTWVAIMKERGTYCIVFLCGGTWVGIVYPVGKEQDSFFPPNLETSSVGICGFCWMTSSNHQIQCLQVTYTKAKFINLDANNETRLCKKGIKRWHFWKVFFSLESLRRKLYVERKTTSPIFVSINKTVASLIAHTPYIFYF